MASGPVKKRKVNDEGRTFKQEWTLNYFFIEEKGKPICLICNQSVNVMKVSNVFRHYDTMQKDEFEELHGGQETKTRQLMKGLKRQQDSPFMPTIDK